MSRKLSLSRAWDDSKDVLRRDGGGAPGGSGAAAPSLPVLALTAGLFLAGGLVLNVFRA